MDLPRSVSCVGLQRHRAVNTVLGQCRGVCRERALSHRLGTASTLIERKKGRATGHSAALPFCAVLALCSFHPGDAIAQVNQLLIELGGELVAEPGKVLLRQVCLSSPSIWVERKQCLEVLTGNI